MGALSDARAAAVLNALFNGGALGAPATYYVALSTTQPNDDGSNVTEPSGSSAAGYARAAVVKNTTNFPTTSGRSISNAVDIVYPDPDPGDDWGVIGWYALYSAATGGTFQGWGAFGDTFHPTESTTGPVLPAGSVIIFAPGSSS
jgi:hypothetical protein